MGWWDRSWRGPYPGRGPWYWLPPPLRPGWWSGRGWCWWLWYQKPVTPIPVDPETEIKYLEELKRYIDTRIEELRKSLGKGQETK